MQIQGSVRSNLLAAIAGAKRWKDRPVHVDTIDHWHRLIAYGKLVERQPLGEPVADLVTELEAEMVHIKAA